MTGLATPLARRLGIRAPIVQAPMAGGWTTPALAAAVSEAGGLGFLPAARTTAAHLEETIAAVRAATDRPFGVNFLLAPPEPPPDDVEGVQRVLDPLRAELGLPPGPRDLRLPDSALPEQFDIVLRERVPVVSFAMGEPGALASRAKERGCTVMVMVTSVEEAREAVRAGADVVIAQGIEAGGHRATFRVGGGRELPRTGTVALVPRVVDAVPVPVVAAGGIMDGRGVAAALALGAQAVQMGTRFLLARESGAYPEYRRWVAEGEGATTVTSLLTGRPARAFRNRILRTLEAGGVAPLPWPFQALAAEDLFRHAVRAGDGEMMALLGGEGAGSGYPVDQPAGEIVAEVVEGAARTLETLRELA